MKDIADTAAQSAPAVKIVKSRGIKVPLNELMNKRHRSLFSENKFEGNLAGTLNKLLTKEDTVVELGTGFGFTAAFMAAKKGVTVNSYEANPTLIPHAQALLDANEITNVTLHHGTFGPRKGAKPVDVLVRKDAMATSLAAIDGEAEGVIIDTQAVDILNTNTVIKDHKPSVLVCSCEGGEVDALAGADLKSLRAAVVILNPIAIGASGIASIFQAMDKADLVYSPRLSNGKLVVFRKA